ncbi:TPA: NAD-dependent epimerase/dehydratase family protein [Morganella morganii]
MKYFITGSAGFIGFSLSKRLLSEGHTVFGIDNMNDYYDVNLKNSRLNELKHYSNFIFYNFDINEKDKIIPLCINENFDCIIHLAAQAGVRYSLKNPFAYAESNLNGYLTILESARQSKIPHLVYASSSSVYGVTDKVPFKTEMCTDFPVSLYAATKKANELMAHSYSHIYRIPTTGLRFFTVYGPWGRPDMALFKFTEAILNNTPIDIFNDGHLSRDFTYIDDIIEGIVRISKSPPIEGNQPAIGTTINTPYKIYNIGNGKPTKLIDFIKILEKEIGKSALKNYLPMQDGDVYTTWADTDDLFKAIGYRPETSLEDGVRNFISWYKSYYSTLNK